MDREETVTYKLCNVKGSCGHWLPDFWFGVDGYSYKEWEDDEDGQHRCVAYGSLCPECYAEKKRFNLILNTEKDERDWMRGKLPEYCCPFCGNEIEVSWNGGWEWSCENCKCSELHGTTVIANPWREE